jgi:hypothetical protein
MLEAVFEGGAGVDLATTTELDPDNEGQRRIGGPVDIRPGQLLTVGPSRVPPLMLLLSSLVGGAVSDREGTATSLGSIYAGCLSNDVTWSSSNAIGASHVHRQVHLLNSCYSACFIVRMP